MRIKRLCFQSKHVLLCAVAFVGVVAVAAPCSAQAGPANGVGTQFEMTFWEGVANSQDPSMYEAYLEKYPDGTFAALARAKVMALLKAAAPVATPAPVAPVPMVAPVPPPVTPTAPAPAPAPAAPSAPAPTPSLAMANTAPPPSPANAPVVAEAAAPVSAVSQLIADLRRQPATASAPVAPYAAPNPTQAPPAASSLPLATGFSMPPRPQLAAVPPVALPPSFCSADERNAFHDGTYQPAVEQAKRNNDAAVAYMTQLRSIYNSYQADSDPNTMNALAAQARDYEPQAKAAYDVQKALVDQFDALMAVPIRSCPVAR